MQDFVGIRAQKTCLVSLSFPQLLTNETVTKTCLKSKTKYGTKHRCLPPTRWRGTAMSLETSGTQSCKYFVWANAELNRNWTRFKLTWNPLSSGCQQYCRRNKYFVTWVVGFIFFSVEFRFISFMSVNMTTIRRVCYLQQGSASSAHTRNNKEKRPTKRYIPNILVW